MIHWPESPRRIDWFKVVVLTVVAALCFVFWGLVVAIVGALLS